MSPTTAEIIATPDSRLPFKVRFSCAGKVVAERPVTSRLAGDELIAALHPTLQGYGTGDI